MQTSLFSSFQGNWIDLLLLGIVVLFLLDGWQRGFFLGCIDLAGYILSFLTALHMYAFLGVFLSAHFSLPKGIANAVGFLTLCFFLELVFSFLFLSLYRFFRRGIVGNMHPDTHRFASRFNRLTGVLPSFLEATVFSAFILTLLIALPVQGVIKHAILSSTLGGLLVSHTQGLEGKLNTVFGDAANETLTFLTVPSDPISQERIDLGFTQSSLLIHEASETELFSLVNAERKKAGLALLSLSPPLRELARDYARDMFERGYFSHYSPDGASPFDRMQRASLSFSAAGENLALAPNVTLAHQGLMNSAGHRANILSPFFRTIGIGVVDGGIYGMIFVQEFTD